MDFSCFLLSFPLVLYVDSLTPHRLPQYAGSGLSPALLHSYTLAAGTFNTHYLKTVHTCTFNFDLSSDVRLTSNCLLDTTAQMSNLTCRKKPILPITSSSLGIALFELVAKQCILFSKIRILE